MTGKAVAKAVVKTKATGKAVAKAVAKAVKKPVVAKAVKPAKAVAKKPTGAKAAKFNFNKLIMLIIRDVPKKGKKMTGGVKDTDVEQIRTKIIDFVGKKINRITTLLHKVDESQGIHKNMSDADIKKDMATKWNGDIHSLILHIYDNKIGKNTDSTNYPDVNKLQEYLTANLAYPKKNDHINDKGVFDQLFMIVVVALCKVYGIINITQNV